MKFAYKHRWYEELRQYKKNHMGYFYILRYQMLCSEPIPPPTRLEKIIRWFREKLGFSGAF